ncbi:hypothetical protein IW150_006127 [Coemansia sp. RSA 2607]|nr:hypothetical protein IW150_006127 [Coemansia sp. RSA 2607]
MAKVVDETIIAVADAMEVYMAAWKGHRIMHRDISTSNILIRRDSQTGKFLNGALIDFDCAIMITGDKPRTDQRPNMTGTFPFMSINCLAASSGMDLCNSCVPRTILDDWESALYVLCWLGTFGINYHDSTAAKHKISKAKVPISKWRTGSPEDVAGCKMSDLSSRQIFNYNILRRFYESPQLQLSSSEPSRAASVSYKPLKRLVESMRMTLFKNPNLSKLGRGTFFNVVTDDFSDDFSDDSSADIPETCWDAHLDPNDRNPFSRRAQVADKIGNALLDVMVKARSEAQERIERQNTALD